MSFDSAVSSLIFVICNLNYPLNIIFNTTGKIIKAKTEHIKYKIEEREYVETIEKAYMFSSKTLLDLLLIEHDLMGRLRSVKHYFLLDKGDFILQFLNLCEKELSKNVDQVLLARLESFLEIGMRMSSANSDPYKEDMRTILMNDDLQSQMFKILSIQTEEEQGNYIFVRLFRNVSLMNS